MNNLGVARAWAHGQHATAPNMSTDGFSIFSYALKIGEFREGLPVVFNYTSGEDVNPFGHVVPSEGFYSVTTSRHVGIARRFGYCFQRGDILDKALRENRPLSSEARTPLS